MTDTLRPLERSGRRGRRRLSPVQKYEAFVQVLTGEMTVVQCADHWGVDRSTIMRAREVAKRGALDALASSRPGTRAGGVDPELVMARDLLADLRRLDKATAHNRRRCTAAVAASGTTLTHLAGISDVLAAKILGHIDNISRFPSADCLASYAGTAPIEASSGDVIRHRLSRHGNRQLNHAIHLAAHTQTIHPGPGRDYYQRRRNTGNSRTEALRLLKRQLTKTIYRTLLSDTARTHHNAAA